MSDLQPPNGDQVPPPPRVEMTMTPPRDPYMAPGVGDPFAPPAEERTNVAGLIAFISALLGFCLPLLPTLVAIVLGIVGVLRPRRGLAIAALILSAIQLLLLAIVAVLIVNAVQRGVFQTVLTVAIAETSLEEALAEEGTGSKIFTVDAPSKFSAEDGWGMAFRTEVVENEGERTIFIWSAGPDKTFDTFDDFVAASSPREAARKAGKPLPDFE